MSKYINIKINVSEEQKNKIKKAVQARTGVSIKLSHADLNGQHVIAVTKAQANKLANAYQNRTETILKLSKTQLMHNTRIEGGFLQFLLPALATVGKLLLPPLATELGSKIANVNSRNGIVYVKKGGKTYKVSQWKKGEIVGNGLWLKPLAGSGYVDGSHMIINENGPFRWLL